MRRQFPLVLTSDFASRGLTAVAGLILVRNMEVSEFAKYVVIAGFANLISGALSGAFGTLLIVGHKQMKLNDRGFELLVLELAIALVISIGAFFATDFFSGLSWLVGALILSSLASEFARDIERQRLAFKSFALFNGVRSLLFVVGIVLLSLYDKVDLTAAHVGLVQTICALVVIAPLRHWLKRKIRFQVLKEVFHSMWRDHFYLFAYVLAVSVFSQLDILLLKFWSVEQEIGAFGSAFRYYAVLVAVLGTINKFLLPNLPLLASPQEMQQLVSKVSRYLWAGIPVLVLFVFISPRLLALVDHGKFPEAVLTFQILCIAAGVSLVLSPYALVLHVSKRHRFMFTAIAIGLLANIIMNSIMIPKYGAAGAASTILIVGAIMNILFYVQARGALVVR